MQVLIMDPAQLTSGRQQQNYREGIWNLKLCFRAEPRRDYCIHLYRANTSPNFGDIRPLHQEMLVLGICRHTKMCGHTFVYLCTYRAVNMYKYICTRVDNSSLAK